MQSIEEMNAELRAAVEARLAVSEARSEARLRATNEGLDAMQSFCDGEPTCDVHMLGPAAKSGIVQEFEARCREAIRGAKFFDKPVDEMDAESLLVFAGYLTRESIRLRDVADRAESERLRASIESFSPRKTERWIPVAERLPEWGVPVIGWFPGAAQSFECKLNEHDGVWSDCETGIHLHEHSRPSHWMPLPSPPSA